MRPRRGGPYAGRTVDVKASRWWDHPALFVGGSVGQFYSQRSHPDLYAFVQIGDQENPAARFVGFIETAEMLIPGRLRPGGQYGNPQIPVEYLRPIMGIVE